MSYRYIDDIVIADAAFEAWGATFEEMIESASDALLGIMVESPESVDPKIRKKIRIKAPSADMLLFRLLNEIVFLKDAESSFFRVSGVVVKERDGELTLDAVLAGEPIDTAKHRTIVDVKAVTMHRFSSEKTENGWKAMVVADI